MGYPLVAEAGWNGGCRWGCGRARQTGLATGRWLPPSSVLCGIRPLHRLLERRRVGCLLSKQTGFNCCYCQCSCKYHIKRAFWLIVFRIRIQELCIDTLHPGDFKDQTVYTTLKYSLWLRCWDLRVCVCVFGDALVPQGLRRQNNMMAPTFVQDGGAGRCVVKMRVAAACAR